MVKELFACWDRKRLGHITMEVLSDNLISFGLSTSQEQVSELISALHRRKFDSCDDDCHTAGQTSISLNNFIKIFERDTFGDKATKLIKEHCIEKKQKIRNAIVAQMMKRRVMQGQAGSRMNDTRTTAAMLRTDEMTHSSFTESRSTLFSTFQLSPGDLDGLSDGYLAYELAKLDLKPSILDQIEITKEWWDQLNTNEDPYLPINKVAKFIVKNSFAGDVEQAEKIIAKLLGPKMEKLDYQEFYMLYCRGIFRTALLDMLNNIDDLTNNQPELPLALKLGAYRRNLMLAGLDKQESELKEKGKSILYALQTFKNDVKPELFASLDFQEYCLDPLGKNKKQNSEKVEKDKQDKFLKKVIFERIKDKSTKMGYNTASFENKLRGEDDEAMKDVIKDHFTDKHKKRIKRRHTSKFQVENMTGLATIAESLDGSAGEGSPRASTVAQSQEASPRKTHTRKRK